MGSARLMSWILIFLLPFIFTGITILALHHYESRNSNAVFPVIPERFKGITWVAIFVRTGCDSCRNLLGELSRLLQHHPSANLPLVVLSLDTPQQLFNFQATSALPFRIHACNDYITEPLNVNRVPDIIFINADGRIVQRQKGRSRYTEKPELILEFLKYGSLTDVKTRPDSIVGYLASVPSGARLADSVVIRELFYSDGDIRLKRSLKIKPDCDCEQPEDVHYNMISETIIYPKDSTLSHDTTTGISQGDVSNYLAQFWRYEFNPQQIPDRGAD